MSYKIWTLVIERTDIVGGGVTLPRLASEAEAELARSDLAIMISGTDVKILKQPKERSVASAVATQRFAELESEAPVKSEPKPIVAAKPVEKPVEKPVVKQESRTSGWSRYEFIGGTSKKFWEISLDEPNCKFTTRWGRIGTDGSITVKNFSSPHEARNEFYKIIESKRNKGYRKVS